MAALMDSPRPSMLYAQAVDSRGKCSSVFPLQAVPDASPRTSAADK